MLFAITNYYILIGTPPSTSGKESLNDSTQSEQVVFAYQDVGVDGITSTYHINQ